MKYLCKLPEEEWREAVEVTAADTEAAAEVYASQLYDGDTHFYGSRARVDRIDVLDRDATVRSYVVDIEWEPEFCAREIK